MDSHQPYYRAFAARDGRFDGVFFVGVTSTGIYCRPICTAKTPKEAHCRFFASAALAEKQGFRPCLRCRPELAPGEAPIDDSRRIAQLIVRRLEEGQIDGDMNLEDIADQFELSSRQIRRIVHKELGVSPIDLIQTRRLLLAKQLLTETRLPVTGIAFASGFSSLRRFNDAFNSRYRMTPSRLRKETVDKTFLGETSAVRLHYRPPYGWENLLSFLSARAIKGAESADKDTYRRTVRIGNHTGWINVRHLSDKNALSLEFSETLIPVLPALIGRVRHLFDLDARPDLIAAHLSKDLVLKSLIERNPGMRLPGTFDSFELAVRAILGQKIAVKAAKIRTNRFIEAFGERIETPYSDLHFLAPTPERIATLKASDITKIGITRQHAESIIALAKAVSSGRLKLETGTSPDKTIEQLASLPGIGYRTAHFIAMRTLRYPDAFPKEDIALRRRLGGVTAKKAEEISLPWRPWRSYAVMHIWHK